MNQKQWRKANPKYRNARRKSNYTKSRPPAEIKKRRISGVKHRPWTSYELIFFSINRDLIKDRDLAILLNRSVQAIQQKRYLIKCNCSPIK